MYASSSHVIDARTTSYDFSVARDGASPHRPAYGRVYSGPHARPPAPPQQRTKRRAGTCFLLGLVVLFVLALIGFGIAALAGAFSSPPVPAPSATPTGVPPAPVVGATEPPALVSSGTPDVEVSVLCNHAFTTGERAGTCIAVFTYTNLLGEPVAVPLGANNYIYPGPEASDHPVTFAAGQWYGAVHADWNCTASASLLWLLRSGDGVSVARTTRAHHACPPLPPFA